MKLFLLRFFMFLLAVLGVYLGMFAVVVFVRTDVIKNTYQEELVKRNRLKNTPGPRIVLVGGSGLAYGVDSPKIESVLHRPVVNMGYNAGLGLCWQMRSAEDDIHKGDVVIISPEYSNFKVGGSFWGEKQPLQVLLDVIPYDMWPTFPLDFWIHHVPDIPELFMSSIKRRVFHLGAHPVEPITNYNEQGDYIRHLKDEKPHVIGTLSELSAQDFDPSGLTEVARFCNVVRDRGATAIMLPPVLHAPTYDKQQGFIEAISNGFASIGCPFVLDTKCCRFDVELMYDTVWHCNSAGVDKRTDMLISVIRGL